MSLLNFTIFTLIAITLGHRSLPDGATCGPQAEPLNIPDPKISWASYRIISCEDPTFRLSGEFDANQYVAFSLGLPLLERFRDVLLNVLVVGPGLPQLSEDDRAKLHPSIIDFQPEQGMGALVFESPLDQSSCGHMKEVMTEATHVQDDRCVFYEPFGGSSSWSVLDEEFHTADAGTYEFIVYSSTGTNAKIWFACCDWPEDFITQYELPEPECEYNCETLETENMWLWQQLFYEYAGMEQYGGFPALQVCADDSSPQEPPTGDQCPSVNDFCKDDDEGMAKFISNFGSQATTCAEASDWCQHAEFGEMVRALCMVTCGECTIDCENDNEGVVGLVANFMPFVKGCDDLIELCDDPEFGQTVGTYCPLTCGLCEAETSSTEEPEEPGMYTVADGKNPCSEETIILDAEVCEMAAIELSLTFVSKFEDKTSRMGCFLSEGFGGGVYYNSHEDASYSDDKDYKSVCKTEMEMTAEPTKIPTMRTERPSTSTMEPTMMTKEPTMMTKEPTMMTKEPTMMTQEPTMMTTEVETTSGPDCEGVCQSDLEKVEEDLKAVESDVAYLINDVPEVLANTFTTVNNLEKMVEDLMKEVERLTALVDDHSARFSCLAAFDEDKMVEQKAF